jgi:hypothetical protein
MSDATANQPGQQQQQGQGQQGQGQLTPEQLAALQPFQNQLTWVATQERASGRAQGEKELTEKLGMTVDEAVKRLAALGQSGVSSQGQQQGQQQQQGQGQQANPELDKRLSDLDQRLSKLGELETRLTEREQQIEQRERAATQDGIRVAALKTLGMTDEQANVAKSMMPLPPGVSEMTPELAVASAHQLKDTFPSLFAPAQGGGAGGGNGGQQQGAAGGPPPDTHTRGTQTAASSGGAGAQSASDKAKQRLTSRGHLKPASS